MKNEEITIYTDGGARGNPGPAAIGFVVMQHNAAIYKGSKYLGIQTNNVAEYTAVIFALEWFINQKLVDNNDSSILFLLDSELVVKQINGLYRVKDENLKVLFTKVVDLMKKIRNKIIFKNIPRSANQEADQLVNDELDGVKVSRQ